MPAMSAKRGLTGIYLATVRTFGATATTVLWLNERDLHISCIRMQPYRLGTSLILDVQQIIPLPEAGDFQVQIRQKQREVRAAAEQASDWTRYDVMSDEGERQGLYKREVVLTAVRQLDARGHTPEEIEKAAGRRLFEVAEGTVDGEAFKTELATRRPNDPVAPKRFFVRNDQLFHADGKTYALTNQWSKTSMETLLNVFFAKFGDYGFSITAKHET
jgi:hypothetical protein